MKRQPITGSAQQSPAQKWTVLKWAAIFSLLAFPGALFGANVSAEDQMTLNVSPVNTVLKSGEKQVIWLRVGVTGFELKRKAERAPVNLAIVLDRSGSMNGEKIVKAREAAVDAIGLLGPNDIVSIVTYDTTVNVLVPATKLTDREQVIEAIRGIQPTGNTALFAGVSKGAAEVRKFMAEDRVNRIILLSDGLANVGPSSPGELGELGASLKKENITVSTLGLGDGYNEDLMVALAGQSGGNHKFIENATELADVFRQEFDDVLNVVAQGVDLNVTIPEGIRPVRVLGNAADINGQSIVTRFAQVYSKQEKFVAIELEIPASENGTTRDLASVNVGYTNMKTDVRDALASTTQVRFSDSDSEVKNSFNRKAMADVVALVASEKNKLATQMLDEGNIAACRAILIENSTWLNSNAESLQCPDLKLLADDNLIQSKSLEGVTGNTGASAGRARKSMRQFQYDVDQQQTKKP